MCRLFFHSSCDLGCFWLSSWLGVVFDSLLFLAVDGIGDGEVCRGLGGLDKR